MADPHQPRIYAKIATERPARSTAMLSCGTPARGRIESVGASRAMRVLP